MEAQPFLYPSLEENKEKVIKNMYKDLKKAFKK